MSIDIGGGAWFPLSAAQQSRWFLYQFDPASQGNHNNVFVASLCGNVDSACLARALNVLGSRHPMLRARIRSGEGERLEQCVAGAAEIALQIVDASAIESAALTARVGTDAWCSFDLNGASLVRAVLYQRCATEAVLLLAFDHLICDGWSYWQLLEELGDLLASGDGAVSLVAEPAPAYADYVAWQREWLSSAAAQKQLSYWEQQLSGEATVLALPSDRGRPKVSSGDQGVVSLTLPAALTEQLAALATRHASSMYTVLLAGFQILLHRYSGQSRIVVGSPMPGRGRSQWDSVAGDFVNVVALRADFDTDPSATDVLRLARSVALKAMRNQDYPFSLLVERLHPSHESDDHPFFQTAFVFQKARRGRALSDLWNPQKLDSVVAHWGEVALKPFPIQQRVANDRIGLGLHAIEFDDRVRCDFTFDADMFDGTTIERLAACFQTVLHGMASDDQQPVSRLPLMPADQYEQVVHGFNQTALAYPHGRLIHQWFEAQVARDPAAIAVVYEQQSLSYAELNRRANQLAHRLISLGVRPDQRVAICVPRSPAMIVGLLGVLKAGAAYVPLDPNYPADRLAYMLADSAPVALLTTTATAPALAYSGATITLDDATLSQQADHNPDAVQLQLTSRHLAYVIYTSGSTGQPKGVAIEHTNASNLITWALASFDATVLHNTLFATSINFDLAIYELFVPLSAGACITLVRDVLGAEAHTPVSLINTVPSGITALLDAGQVPLTARQINLAGEPLKQRTVERLFAATSAQAVANLYGPTETTTYSTWVQIPRGAPFPPHIGRPLANTQVYVLDAAHQPVPIGVIGEIYIGGAGVARGYLERPTLTAERFLRDPFAGGDARMYKTGDLGRWLASGDIEYLGRNDFQVKIRGFRVELGEVEARLSACDGVREAVVVAREGATGDKQLVAYVVAASGVSLSVATLRESLARDLADYMIPSAFVSLAALPLTPNGKLNRSALPAPDADAVASRDYVPPHGRIEQEIAWIWQQLLGLPRVGRHDHFFELGGNSLLALQVVSRVRVALNAPLTLRELFAQPTLIGLAALLSQSQPVVAQSIAVADRSAPLPLSWSQQRLWFLGQLDRAAGAAYHMPAALNLKGHLQRAALQATLDRIVARHESLRTTFVSDNDQPRQQIAPAHVGFSLVDHDLRTLDAATQAARVDELSAAEASEPFDLARGPLIRGRLLQLADDEHVLLVTQHHIISDGWSVGVLIRELTTLYAAFCSGQPDPLPPLPIQYADYAVWQRQRAQGDGERLSTEFWREHLSGAPALLELPTDRARPTLQSYIGGSIPVVLDAELVGALRALSQRHGVTLFMSLLAAWSVVLSRLSGQDDIVVGTPVANRPHAQTEELIGFFVNTLALRVRLQDDPTVAQLLAQIRATTLDAYEHQELPFEQVVEALQPARSLGHSPLFQAVLTLNNTPGDRTLHLPGLDLAPREIPHSTTRFDLTLALGESADAITGELEFASDLFERATAQRYRDYFLTLLAGMVADDHCKASHLPLLGESERRRLTREFNDTAAAYREHDCIHQVFEDWAARQPQAMALRLGSESLSYGQLNLRANQLAHRLRELGVGTDDCVAVCAQRGMDLIVALLAILKAGGAYVPLDPSYPPERLGDLLEDCAPVVVLTHSSLRAAAVLANYADACVLDMDDPSLAQQPSHNLTSGTLSSRQLAYVIYTSGSTGRPKGVMVEHRSVLRLVINNAYTQIAPEDCLGHCANPAFDASTWEIWAALLNGASLLIVPAPVVLDSVAFARTLLDGGVTALWLTVGLFNEYADTLAPAFAQLKYLLVGGDALDPRPVARVLKSAQRPQQLLNCYGPTETTTFATTHRITTVADDASSIPIGKPIANTQVYILDARHELVPVGVIGELYIGGVGVARGYLKRPELTAERFVADPYSDDPTARLYRSGDLGRWLPDGSIEYLGRNDFQVKVRGFRIELGEIEAKLAACVGVREAVVIARGDDSGSKRLLAYVIAHSGIELQVGDLRGQLAAHLPDYMMPSAFVVLPSFPLTGNGKLDRKALPTPDHASLLGRDYEAPVGDVETTIAAIWQDLLQRERIGRNDHFFELGGHSLLVMRLVTRLREQCHVDVALSLPFERPVLSALADAVRTLQLEVFLGEDLEDMQDELDSLSEAELLEILSRESVNE